MPEPDLVQQLDHAIDLLFEARPSSSADPELEALTQIATELRDLPSEKFKTGLKAELLRRTIMSVTASAPASFRTVTPFIIHAQAPELVGFIKHTFGAEELKRNTAGEAHGFYSEMRVGDSMIMIGGGTAARWGNLPSALHVYVDDCDAAYQRALESGAITLMGEAGRPADRPYGERSAFIQDRFGNYWYIATRLASAGTSRDAVSILPYLHPMHARRYLEFLNRAFGAEEMSVYEDSDRVVHAAARFGDAVVELGEPEDRTGIPANGLFFFVEDVDAAYDRALAAGAEKIRAPEDIPYGMRSAIVKDPEGYLWWPARWLR